MENAHTGRVRIARMRSQAEDTVVPVHPEPADNQAAIVEAPDAEAFARRVQLAFTPVQDIVQRRVDDERIVNAGIGIGLPRICARTVGGDHVHHVRPRVIGKQMIAVHRRLHVPDISVATEVVDLAAGKDTVRPQRRSALYRVDQIRVHSGSLVPENRALAKANPPQFGTVGLHRHQAVSGSTALPQRGRPSPDDMRTVGAPGALVIVDRIVTVIVGELVHRRAGRNVGENHALCVP